MVHGSNDPSRQLPIPSGWRFSSMSDTEATRLFGGGQANTNEFIPSLPGITRYYSSNRSHSSLASQVEGVRMRGWQGPGPGPPRGRARIPTMDELKSPFFLAAIHLVKESLHFQQLYSFHSVSHYSSPFELSTTMSSLSELERSLPVSTVMKRNIWTLTHQLGVPGFLLKLKSPYHAMAIHLLPDTGMLWSCSFCTFVEVNHRSNCRHAEVLNNCITQVSSVLSCSSEYLVSSMIQSAAFNHIPDLSVACFYGSRKRHEFSVLRHELRDRRAPITSGGRIHIVKRLAGNRGWRCLNRSCAGVSQTCSHLRSIEIHVQRGLTHCFSNIHDLLGPQKVHSEIEDGELDTQLDLVSLSPRYSRPLVPSDLSFQIDFNVIKNAHNGTRLLLTAARSCQCGISRDAGNGFPLSVQPLRVETTRCFVDYEQEIWKCGNGHIVTPEHETRTREGYVWISRDTAFTEVFLFDLLLHMTVGGATLSSQSELRAQLLSLQTEYMSRDTRPRSPQSIRKALIIYAMSVVQDIPSWVFRCSKCVDISDGKVYYDKLSFDGQQVGFNITKDVRYDFYGKPSTPWRRPVKRDSKAATITLLIQSRSLRMIILEALRVRGVPQGSTSVNSICRAMMGVSLRTKDAIRAAVAAVKLFDPEWAVFLPAGTPIASENSYSEYVRSTNPDLSAHPIHFIVKENNPTPTDFNRALLISDIFRHILDCRKAAKVISVLINDLRGDLKSFIPSNDREFIRSYSQHAITYLNSWLRDLAHLNSWSLIMPNMTNQQVQEIVAPGIAEHVGSLDHPVRTPFSWQEYSDSQHGPNIVNMFSRVRMLGPWICPREAQTSIIMLFMALLNEPVHVWLRDRQFMAIEAGIEVLQNAFWYCGEADVFESYRNALGQTHCIGLLYEGLLGIIGANTSEASPMYTTARKILELIPILQTEYELAMRESVSTKQFMCTPKEFDDMLYWTEAVPSNNHTTDPETKDSQAQSQGQHMKQLYDKLAKSRSNDFLETGIWAPDFPIRRPSPSSSMWATDIAHTEASCSKNFNIHNAFSPGTFGAYCLCKHAKTLMITFLKRPEGCRMPLNAIVERCARLPRYVIYDFACGTQKAAACLSSEVTRRTRFIVDPFHFPGHKTCSLAMHEASYEDLRGCNMESQEQRNSNIKVMERTLRASKDVHFIHFVILAHAYLNMKAMYLDYRDSSSDEVHVSGTADSWLRWIRETYQERSVS